MTQEHKAQMEPDLPPNWREDDLDVGDQPADVTEGFEEETGPMTPLSEQPDTPPSNPAILRSEDLSPNGGFDNIMQVMALATPEEVDYWANWYPVANRETMKLAAESGHSFDAVAGVVAVLSPGVKWEQNVALAEEVMQQEARLQALMENSWTDNPEEMATSKATGKPSTYKPGDKSKALKKLELRESHGLSAKNPTFVQKALDILAADDPMVGQPTGVTGPKVSVFYYSIVDPQGTSRDIVLDGHAINIWRGDTNQSLTGATVSKAQRAEMVADYQKAGDAWGLKPQEVQAVTWSIWRTVKQKSASRMAQLEAQPGPDELTTLQELHGLSDDQMENMLRSAGRMGFRDELYTRGELELADVRIGDRVHFEAALTVDDVRVPADTIATVTAVNAGANALEVDAQTIRTAVDGAMVLGSSPVTITPRDATVLVQAKDPRLSTFRIGKLLASLGIPTDDATVRIAMSLLA